MKRLICVIFVLALAAALSAGEWHIETVDSDGYVGRFTSIALDDFGYPHISYQDHGNSDLKYAYWDGASWQIETVESDFSTGFYTSLVLDSSNHPNIAYFNNSWNSLRYARWDGASWQIEIVDTGVENLGWNSLALDSFEYPHISYWDNTDNDLKYARWDGAGWQIETVDSAGNTGHCTSLALDDYDRPHISYGLYSLYRPDELKYAHWDGERWQIETVDSDDDVGAFTSLALDSSDYPHIAYCDLAYDDDLKYAQWDGADWIIETVDSEGDVGNWTCLALDSSGYPHISYRDYIEDNCNLKYARWDGSSWQIETVDSGGDVGDYTSLALDSYDNPHISYCDEINEDLKYAWYGDPQAVEGAELSANVSEEGILIGWEITGDAPAGFNVLRSVGEGEPAVVSGRLDGAAVHWLDRDVSRGAEYRYWLEVTEEDGTTRRFGPTEPVTFPGSAGKITLAVYPSPASGSFTVDYTLPVDGEVTISLYDLSGRRVTTLLDENVTFGRHEFTYDTSALPPGVYLAHLSTDAGVLTRRVVITR
jgi:hypothetical protein